MLAPDEEKYINSIAENKKIIIQKFNPASKETANYIISNLKKAGIESEIYNIGSSELGISGQNDIDISILSSPERYKKELPIIENLFGQPLQKDKLPMKWEFEQAGFEVELYLSDSTTETFKKHMQVFLTLQNNIKLLENYEKMKKSCDGRSYREYMKKKFKFFHKILEKK